jgi:hypothetical protein
MHEIATQTQETEDLKNPVTADKLTETFESEEPLSATHINALSACLNAIDGIFEVFLSMEVSSIRCLPVFNFVRVAYAVVVLIKLYFAASSSKGELGRVINKDNMKVEQHLENLLDRFRATAADEKSRPAAKFLVVLVMLKSWFIKQSQLQPAKDKRAAAAAMAEANTYHPQQAPQQAVRRRDTQDMVLAQKQHQEYAAARANTPLELLSEIAATDSGDFGGGGGGGAAPSTPWYPNGHARQFSMYDSPGGTGTPSTGPPPSTMNPHHQQMASWLNSTSLPPDDFDYTSFGDGFAQAMDMTLAGLSDGSLGLGLENGMRYIMQGPAMFGNFMVNMEDAATAGGPAMGGPPGGMGGMGMGAAGGFQF